MHRPPCNRVRAYATTAEEHKHKYAPTFAHLRMGAARSRAYIGAILKRTLVPTNSLFDTSGGYRMLQFLADAARATASLARPGRRAAPDAFLAKLAA